jgi:hypothetical protein
MTIEPNTCRFISLGARLAIVALLVLGGVGLGGGCGESTPPPAITKKAVPFGEVPAELRLAAEKALPGVELDEAWQNLNNQGELHSYEIRGRQPSTGKIREVRVSLAGEILEME